MFAGRCFCWRDSAPPGESASPGPRRWRWCRSALRTPLRWSVWCSRQESWHLWLLAADRRRLSTSRYRSSGRGRRAHTPWHTKRRVSGNKVYCFFIAQKPQLLCNGKYFTRINAKVNKNAYLQNLKRIFSKTRTGPVLPRMVRGWPANREYAIPVIEAPNRDSIALCKENQKKLSDSFSHTWIL